MFKAAKYRFVLWLLNVGYANNKGFTVFRFIERKVICTIRMYCIVWRVNQLPFLYDFSYMYSRQLVV